MIEHALKFPERHLVPTDKSIDIINNEGLPIHVISDILADLQTLIQNVPRKIDSLEGSRRWDKTLFQVVEQFYKNQGIPGKIWFLSLNFFYQVIYNVNLF